eukprot:CAMPEP_0172311552 /NCGR_PEP_ID=MMETSP1058-20130122/15116_1 /TAXON_ID=83371 /ORGANISM="Detonula confervacea, Strain CCMP 353" /LENGTH=186 /DNA_ID=CAMNT_0013024773 /DNA_START=115 /DNA_END=675 /DNA_ORIENTATION=-
MILAAPADSFTASSSHFEVAKRFAASNIAVSPLQASRVDLSSKEFQLEELEDKEECETEMWLNEDGSVTLGVTNGPPVKDYKGDWHLLETASEADRPFRMRLTRSYDGGSPGNLGDISYEVKREFWGNIEMVGDSISVSGKTHGSPNPDSGNAYIDELSLLESELGFFSMIDAVASEGIEGEKQKS